jgi:hypothetical protein
MSRVHNAIAPAVESASTPVSTMNHTSIAELPDFVTQGRDAARGTINAAAREVKKS